MRWQLSAAAWSSPTTIRELRAAKTRKLSLKLRAPSTLSFFIPGDHDQAKLITELVTDVTVTCWPRSEVQTPVLLARCGASQDNVGESGYGVTFTFADYRAVLERRALKAADTLYYAPGTEQSDIVWGMVTNIQARANGNLGITRGVGAVTGQTREKSLIQGSYVGKEIWSLSQLSNGFEWDVSPTKVLNLYFPSRGLNNGVGLEYGKSVSNFSRSRNPSAFANDDIVTGKEGTVPVEQASATVTTDPEGRWDGVYSFPDVSEQATLVSKAAFTVATTSQRTYTYNVQLAPGYWQGPAHIGLGDTVRLRAKRGRIDDNILLRVLEINLDLDDDGDTETVRLALGS